MWTDPDAKKNGTPASPATARAKSVFPVPGGLYEVSVSWPMQQGWRSTHTLSEGRPSAVYHPTSRMQQDPSRKRQHPQVPRQSDELGIGGNGQDRFTSLTSSTPWTSLNRTIFPSEGSNCDWRGPAFMKPVFSKKTDSMTSKTCWYLSHKNFSRSLRLTEWTNDD